MAASRINFGQLIREAAAESAATRKQNDESRAKQRADVQAALELDVVRRAAESDPRLKEQLAATALALHLEEEQSLEAGRRLTASVDALVAQLGKLTELRGQPGGAGQELGEPRGRPLASLRRRAPP